MTSRPKARPARTLVHTTRVALCVLAATLVWATGAPPAAALLAGSLIAWAWPCPRTSAER
jgi:hypothetical protein